MNEAPRQIKDITSAEVELSDGPFQRFVPKFPLLTLERQGRCRLINTPRLPAFDLQNKDIVIIGMRKKALGARRSEVGIRTDTMAQISFEAATQG